MARCRGPGIRRAVGVIAAAQRSYSSCTQYKENVAAARATLRERGLADVEVTYVGDWYTHPGFIEANAARVRDAIATLPPALQERAELVFTAHSIPVSMADKYPYRRQFEETCALIAASVNARRAPAEQYNHVAVYQSRSGRPEDPWLGPDIGEYLRDLVARGVPAAVLSPAGFLIDHVEVLYDLDVEAAAIAGEIGLTHRPRRHGRRPPAVPGHAGRRRDGHRPRYAGRPLPLVATLDRGRHAARVRLTRSSRWRRAAHGAMTGNPEGEAPAGHP